MIFVTVGTQLPFDRLVLAVDRWAAAHPEIEFFAQTCEGAAPPPHMPHKPFLGADEVDQFVRKAELIVSHAGMGSVLTALQFEKPILILPRKSNLGEHRSDHQVSTAKWLATRPGVQVAWHEDEVATLLDARQQLTAGPGIGTNASAELISRLRDYIFAKHR